MKSNAKENFWAIMSFVGVFVLLVCLFATGLILLNYSKQVIGKTFLIIVTPIVLIVFVYSFANWWLQLRDSIRAYKLNGKFIPLFTVKRKK